MTKHVGDVGYTDDELKEMIAKMRAVSGGFYPAACSTGCHAFIEFTGLMTEFIKLCEQSLAAEMDFASSNTHSGKALVVHPYNAAYIVEKLDCIFGPSIRSSKEVEAEFAKLTPGASEEAEDRRQFCTKVHVEPLLDAVRVAGLTEAQTEGPYGGGGIDHAATIAFFGTEVARLNARVTELLETNNRYLEEARAARRELDNVLSALKAGVR